MSMFGNSNFKIKMAPGAKIANCKGIPGTIGCLAFMKDTGQTVVLSSWHVMYGNGATKGDKMWLVEEFEDRKKLYEIGRVLAGKMGLIRFHNWEVYVDCAISTYMPETTVIQKWFSGFTRNSTTPLAKMPCEARVGEQVYKTGSATGITQGIVVNDRYTENAFIEGQIFDAKGQLLIRSMNGLPFSAEGDSGAVILNKNNEAVGLLWGTNRWGEGVACPIAPVLSVLNIDFGLPMEK